jgi:hypothetical protein
VPQRPAARRRRLLLRQPDQGADHELPGHHGTSPATCILAGVSRAGDFQQVPLPALAQFGVVYFDDISAYTTSGPRSLTSGDAVTMTDQNGSAIATPERLTDSTFKTVWQ